MIIWSLFDHYLIIIWSLFDDYCVTWVTWSTCVKICKGNDSPNFAFARLCCLKTQVVRPARPAKVISNFLDSSLQSVPHAFRCAWCIQPSGKNWPQRGRQHSASRSAMRDRGNPLRRAEHVFWRKAVLVRADSPLLGRTRPEPGGVSGAREKAAKLPPGRRRRSASNFP